MLSKAAQAVCVASACLAATTTTTTTTTVEAFLVPPVAIKGTTATARGHHQRQRGGASCARCNPTPVVVRSSPSPSWGSRATATTMRGDFDNNNRDNDNRRSKLYALRKRLLSRKRDTCSAEPLERQGDAPSVVAAAGVEDRGVSARVRVQQRVREVVRRSFVAIMTGVIIRSSFNPQAASAMGLYRPKLGRSTTRQVQVYL